MAGKSPVILCILDGWGHRLETQDNAVALAQTPIYDSLWATAPQAFLHTSGGDVGLPEGQMGNSEVGHMNLGAGRVVLQDLPRIDQAVAEGTLAEQPAIQSHIAALKESGGTCHLLGLLSPGGVHSHQDHLVALAKTVASKGVPVLIHAFLDGRDTPPQSALDYLARFEQDLGAAGKIATLCGRYFAMDRDKNWERTSKAFRALTTAEGNKAESALGAVEAAYAAGETDEFVSPAILGDYPGMKDGDGVFMANFRADRARQILTALLDPAFNGFDRGGLPKFAVATGLVEYSEAHNALLETAFAPQTPEQTLGEVVADAGLTQLRIAETEKYAHVTFFFNGGREQEFAGEDRILVPSPKVATYDLQPEMSAPEVTERLLEAVTSGRYDLIVVNYANPDMVGHTGDLQAAIKAVETVDGCLGRLIEAVKAQGGSMLVTADHGNVELMRDPETGNPHTAHTTLPVPIFLVRPEGADLPGLAEGRLADVAPTLLALLGQPQPAAMTGQSLLGRTAEAKAESPRQRSERSQGAA